MSPFPLHLLLWVVFLAVPLLLTTPLDAQWRTPDPGGVDLQVPDTGPIHENVRLPATPLVVGRVEPAYARMVGMGLVGGALGAGVGLLLAYGSGDIGIGVMGASLGAAAGIPIGVHLGNGARGNLLAAELISVALSAAVFFSVGTDGGAVPILIAAPALEIATAVLIEATTSR